MRLHVKKRTSKLINYIPSFIEATSLIRGIPQKLLSSCSLNSSHQTVKFKMISDEDLYSLAIFLGSAAVLLIILYHFLEVNAVEEAVDVKAAGTSQTDAKVPVGR